MRVGFGGHRMNEGNVIDMARHVRQHGRTHFARLSLGFERPGTFHDVAVFPLKADEVFFAGQWLAMILFQAGFVFPQVHMRGGAGAEDLQDPFGFWREMGFINAGLPVFVRFRIPRFGIRS